MKDLSTPLQYIKGVGPHLGQLFQKKDIYTVEDALYFIPRSYENRASFTPIKDLNPGSTLTSFGAIKNIRLIPMRSKRRSFLEIWVADTSGHIILKWFRYNKQYMLKRYKAGMHVVFTGDVKIYRNQKEIAHPDLEIIENPNSDHINFGRIVPVYSLTEGLYQKTVRKILHNTLIQSETFIEDPLPEALKTRNSLIDLKTSFKQLHYPDKNSSMDMLFEGNHPARQRLAFDEFFFLELGLALKRDKVKKEKTTPFKTSDNLKPQLCNALPFELTGSQKIAISEIEKDISKPHPMHRLIQGDVGSGKTLVGLISALSVIEQKFQVAMMAPTEILAQQHFVNLQKLLKPLKVNVALLKSDMKKSDKDKLLQEIKTGFYPLVIGTHALIQKEVEFNNLGLVIIDEQHRFGVEQRLTLKKKGLNPHLLFMTATPIPRSLALTLYGDLDVTVMTDLPPGRKPVSTKVVRESQRLKLYEFMTKQLAKGQQAYVIYPLIEESEKMDLKDATQMAEHLSKIFSKFKIQLLHGKLKSEEKIKIMKAFKENKIQVLVSTTVIEVGVDVPNSSMMLIEHAERFGLSQLHQLRGRVGRGSEKSYCFLLAQHQGTEESKIRLKAMEEYTSGFKIAEEDLKLRGPGEFLGKRQSGLAGFRVANLVTDQLILHAARKEAFLIVEKDPKLSLSEHQPLKAALEKRWQKKIDLIGAG